MAAVEIGRLCVKLAGRDAGRDCLIVDTIDNNFVLVDGNTRRKKVNVDHLELLPQKAEIKKGASHEEVVKALEGLGIKIEKKAAPRVKKEIKIEATKLAAKEIKAEKKETKTKKTAKK